MIYIALYNLITIKVFKHPIQLISSQSSNHSKLEVFFMYVIFLQTLGIHGLFYPNNYTLYSISLTKECQFSSGIQFLGSRERDYPLQL